LKADVLTSIEAGYVAARIPAADPADMSVAARSGGMSCRSHRIRDTGMKWNLLRRASERREEGEVGMVAGGSHPPLIGGSSPGSSRSGNHGELCYAPPTTNQRRWVAKPVESRHSPATVIARFDEERA
jgi:hypothetical protein